MISYNSAINSEVMEILDKCGIEGHTRWTQVLGKGKTSGSHFGSDVWPGENSVIFSAMEDGKSQDIISGIKDLRGRLGKEGVKAFVWPLEEVT